MAQVAFPKTNIVQIVAPGGVGKTQLVKKWRENLLAKKNHGGALRAFDWSFYSQGTQQQASADEFFDEALRWFGETELEKDKDPWSKGERLAELAKRQACTKRAKLSATTAATARSTCCKRRSIGKVERG